MIDPHALRTLIEQMTSIETAMFQQARGQRDFGEEKVAMHLERFARDIHAVLSALPETPPEAETCVWTYDRDECDWATACGQEFVAIDDCELDFAKFCCFCGKPALFPAPPPPSEEPA